MTGLEPRPVPWRSRALLPVLVYSSLCTAVVGSLGVLLIPAVAADQHITVSAAQWMLTANLLVGAVTTPVLGRLSDGPHRRRVLLFTLATVLTGSLLAATAHSFPQLLLGRALQGATYSVIPMAIASAHRLLPKERAPGAIAVLSVMTATGAGLGFPLTGLIAQHLDYHYAFWFAAAFIAPALVGVLLAYPADRTSDDRPSGDRTSPQGPAVRRAARFDTPGALLLAAALTGGLIAVSQGSDWGWTSMTVLLPAGASLLLGAVWVWWEGRVAQPLVRLDLLRHADVVLAHVAAVSLGALMYVAFSATSAIAQAPSATGYGLALAPFLAGCAVLPLSLGSQLATQLQRGLVSRVGTRVPVLVAAAMVASANVGLALGHDRVYQLLVAMLLIGLGTGLAWVSIPVLLVPALPADELGSALGFNQILRTLGGALGSALTGAVLATHTTTGGGAFPTDSGYRAVFVIGAMAGGVVLVLLVVHALLVRRRGTAGRQSNAESVRSGGPLSAEAES
ncbi:MFS transporter [Streptomyces sp. NPDC060205]|uniref:MFS transporter n=1 Tax=Streptomyces sp. NPDC060205 TaxID=3347072 RepID=UPI003666C45B